MAKKPSTTSKPERAGRSAPRGSNARGSQSKSQRRQSPPSRPVQSPSMKEETIGPDIDLDQLKRRQGGVDRRVII